VSVDELSSEVLQHNDSELMLTILRDLRERRFDLRSFCQKVRHAFGADLLLTVVRALQTKQRDAIRRQRLMANMRRLQLIGRVAPRLLAAHARAVDRLYAPGGAGFHEARAQFADAAGAQRKRKLVEDEAHDDRTGKRACDPAKQLRAMPQAERSTACA